MRRAGCCCHVRLRYRRAPSNHRTALFGGDAGSVEGSVDLKGSGRLKRCDAAQPDRRCRNRARPARLSAAHETLLAERSFALDQQIGSLMRVAMQRHKAIFLSRMTSEITQRQFAVLVKLLEKGPCSQNHLGRLVHLDGATTKGIVDRLTLRRLVTAQADPNDQRVRAITLTKKGRAATKAAIERGIEITAETLLPLTAEECQRLSLLLKKLTMTPSEDTHLSCLR
jgi:MarR family transcriptional regulator, lower aerobic nicotinate degradation pathway regulator